MRLPIPRSLVLRTGTVLDTYPGLGFGNYLYFALQAHIERLSGHRAWVLNTGIDPRWTEAMPTLRGLLTSPGKAALRHVRYIPERFYQEYGKDFSTQQLQQFLTDIVLPARPQAFQPPDLVVNVRRGDYYSNPGLSRIYAFDVPAYVRHAVGVATAENPVSWLSVVSDDAAWCREELAWLSDQADHVTFGAQVPGPVGDFWEVASSRCLVLTNSTFSYWAAYTSQALHGESHRGVWAPDFHQWNIAGGRPWQHAPSWHSIRASPREA
jgi:Glycosyl transferase family 11